MPGHYRYRGYLGQCGRRLRPRRRLGTVSSYDRSRPVRSNAVRRFEQVKPTFIFAVDAVVYNAKAKVHDHLPKLAALLSGLETKSDSCPKIVIIHSIPYVEDRSAWREGWVSWDDFILGGEAEKLGRAPSGEILWHRASFNWPLWILFSSGSTGKRILL